jgi:hypothetical protein
VQRYRIQWHLQYLHQDVSLRLQPGNAHQYGSLDNTYTLATDTANTSQCSSYAQNSRCRLAAHTCVDSTPCKLDSSGATVCLAGVTPPAGGLNSTATCWRYQDDYSCIAENHIDYCAPSRRRKGVPWSARPATARRSTAPATNIPDGINAPTSRHRPSTPTVVELNTSYTITSNTLDTSQCASLASSANCVHAATTCTDSTPCKTINGLQVCLTTVSHCRAGAQSSGDSCWTRSEDYTCAGSDADQRLPGP